ncbi:MAG: Ig-like domain-containing protein [Flavobacteriaceae bacterium]|nr:Ig-like domain-containing protein [Flavobacteriaceae bacterium]
MNKSIFQISMILLLLTALLVSCSENDSPSEPPHSPPVTQIPDSSTTDTEDTDASSQVPRSVSLREPENAANCTTANHIDEKKSEVTFLWTKSSNTSRYEINIENVKKDFSFKINTSDTSFKIILDREEHYHWWVVSKSDSTEEIATSEKWSFYLQGIPEQYHAPFPAVLKGNATKETVSLRPREELLFEWEGEDVDNDITFYQLWLGTSEEQLELMASEITEQSYSMMVELDTQYYWQIATVDEVGNLSKSMIQSFSTVALEIEKISPKIMIIGAPNRDLDVNETYELESEYFDDIGDNVAPPSAVNWISSDISKATVDPNTGLVTGVDVGTADITVRVTINEQLITDTITISIVKPRTDGQIEINDDYKGLFLVGQTRKFTFKYYNTEGIETNLPPNGKVIWKSNGTRAVFGKTSPDLAELVELGQETIMARLTFQDHTYLETSLDITITQGPAIWIIKDLPSPFKVGDRHTLTYQFWNSEGKEGALERGPRWDSSRSRIAEINPGSGEITAREAGTTTIKARVRGSDELIEDTYKITIIE